MGRVAIMSPDPNAPASNQNAGPTEDAVGRPALAPHEEQPEGGPDAVAVVSRERDEYRDLLLRKTAEFDNYRKRVERERREEASAEVAELLESLLRILDDFERALAMAADNNPQAYRAGIELIHRQLLDLLARNGVTAIEALGADFDPHLHEAVVAEPRAGCRNGEVIEELRRGYRLGERLLRPAMVKVART